MKSKHFIIEELVPEDIFNKRGQRAWQLINPLLLKTIDTIKEKFPDGSMSINTWKWNGSRVDSGLRTPTSQYYSSTSQHSLGNAIDAIFSKYNVEEVRQYILDNPEEFPYIKGIELGISWLHIDVRNSDTLLSFYS